MTTIYDATHQRVYVQQYWDGVTAVCAAGREKMLPNVLHQTTAVCAGKHSLLFQVGETRLPLEFTRVGGKKGMHVSTESLSTNTIWTLMTHVSSKKKKALTNNSHVSHVYTAVRTACKAAQPRTRAPRTYKSHNIPTTFTSEHVQ